MKNTVLIIGNGFDMDLGINLSFLKWRNSHHCLSYELSKSNPKGDLWNDFEKSLREAILAYHNGTTSSDIQAKDINLFWQGFWKFFSVFFSEETQDYPDIRTVKENCAYDVLKHLNESSVVFTFNYTYPYEYVNLPPICEFNFVHGRYIKDYFVGGMAMMIQSHNMILGIDYKRMPQQIISNKYLAPIIKKQNPSFEESGIETALDEAENVIFFGHSLGITDSDYFDEFFSKIANDESLCKRIFIITLDQDSYSNIIESAKLWGVDFDRLSKSNIEVIPIFTSLGINQATFKGMLSLL